MKDKTLRLLQSPKIRRVFQELCVEGDRTEITIGGEVVKATDIAHHYGVDLKKADKYKEEAHAGMEQSHTEADTSDTGDGDSQEQE